MVTLFLVIIGGCTWAWIRVLLRMFRAEDQLFHAKMQVNDTLLREKRCLDTLRERNQQVAQLLAMLGPSPPSYNRFNALIRQTERETAARRRRGKA